MNEAPVLKQMTVVQILDASFRLYRENFMLFMGIMAVPFVPVIIGMIAVTGMLGGSIRQMDSSDPAGVSAATMSLMIIGLISMAFFILLYLIAVPIARGALTRAVSDRYLGRPASFGESYRAIFSMFWRYLGTTLLVGLVVGLGFIACVIPGIFLFTLFAFVPMIMIIEGQAGTDAMGRSKDLSAGHRWRIFGLAVLTVVINWFLGAIIGLVFDVILPRLVDSPTLLGMLSMAASQVLTLLLEPIWTLSFILLYYDVRIRKEAFDLHLMALRTA